MSRILSIAFSSSFILNGFAVEKEKPFVSCRISGQLANNLNQIATTLAYAWDYGAEPYFPELNKEEWNISYNRDYFFFRLNSNSPPRPIQNIHDEYENEGGWWDCKKVTFEPDLYLSGDFFCWKHFHHYRNQFLDLFEPSSDVSDYIHLKYKHLLTHPKTVSVHVRTYNKEYHESTMKFVGLEYYKKAMSLFSKDTLFVVFSDRINWCKKYFSSFSNNCVFIEGNDHIQDFFLMSMLKSHIIANSCYSWWAAYLNTNPDKVVIAPKRTGRWLEDLTHNIYFPDWILIEPNLSEPYPVDIKDFDLYSTSTDTQ